MTVMKYNNLIPALEELDLLPAEFVRYVRIKRYRTDFSVAKRFGSASPKQKIYLQIFH